MIEAPQKSRRDFLFELKNKLPDKIIKINNYGRASSYIIINLKYGWNIYGTTLVDIGYSYMGNNIYCLRKQEVELVLHNKQADMVYKYPSKRCL